MNRGFLHQGKAQPRTSELSVLSIISHLDPTVGPQPQLFFLQPAAHTTATGSFPTCCDSRAALSSGPWLPPSQHSSHCAGTVFARLSLPHWAEKAHKEGGCVCVCVSRTQDLVHSRCSTDVEEKEEKRKEKNGAEEKEDITLPDF